MISKILAMLLTAILTVSYAAPLIPATPTDEFAVYEDGVVVCVELDTPLSEIHYGNPVVLRCIVVGIDEPYTIQWQHSVDMNAWYDLPCNDEVYEFIMDHETAGTYYRVVINTNKE